MIDGERIEELIAFHRQNLASMKNAAAMFGGGAIADMAMAVGRPLIEDTIKALAEYKDMQGVKLLVDK